MASSRAIGLQVKAPTTDEAHGRIHHSAEWNLDENFIFLRNDWVLKYSVFCESH